MRCILTDLLCCLRALSLARTVLHLNPPALLKENGMCWYKLFKSQEVEGVREEREGGKGE